MKFIPVVWLLLGSLLSAAGLKFEKEIIEVKAALDSKILTADFKFTNTNPESVTITNADGGCPCVSVQMQGGKMTYAPGESGLIRVTFEVGVFQGTLDKPIAIWLKGDSDAEKPSNTVTLRVIIPVAIALEPKTLKWELNGEANMQVLDIRMDYDKPIHVTSVTVSNPAFKSKLVTVEEGKHYQVEVTPAGTGSPGLTIIRVETDIDVERQRVQQGFGVIRAPLPKIKP